MEFLVHDEMEIVCEISLCSPRRSAFAGISSAATGGADTQLFFV